MSLMPFQRIRLSLLFGILYLVQGLSEPTTGILSQPDQALLRAWGDSPEQIARFVAVLAIPWCFKPVFGFMSDYFPLAGYRRRSYLLVASFLAVGGFWGLFLLPLAHGADGRLLAWLLPATVAVVCADVVIDALMIETGQPLGITGQLQSVQWAAVYIGTIITGVAGGLLAEFQLIQFTFLLCGALMTCTFLLTLTCVRERRQHKRERQSEVMVTTFPRALRSPSVRAVSAILFLWHFNPFSLPVLYVHATGPLEFSERFYGATVSLAAIGSLLACIAYGFYCRRVPMGRLAHLSVASGIASTWVYWLLADQPSAVPVSIAAGFAYMTGSMIQVDLAARACPLDAPGTMFATFMAACNVSTAIATWLGGLIYQLATNHWGSDTAFDVLIFLGGLFTATSWLAIGYLPARLLTTPTGTVPVAAPLPGAVPHVVEPHEPHG